MADNVTANPGVGGSVFATDNIGGVQYPRSKVTFGVAGVATDVSATDALPVTLPAAQITTLTPPAAITGYATSANQTTELASLSSIDGKTPALGQQLAGASSPVVLTASQITTLTPPAAITGYATSANQTTELASLSSIDAKTAALGQQLAAASSPVVLTAAQVTTLTPPAAIVGFALEAGNLATIAAKDFATRAKQDTMNTSLGLLATAAAQTTGNTSLSTITSAIKSEDTAAADLDKGIANLGVRQDFPITDTSDSGDYAWLKTDAQGRLWVNSGPLAALISTQTDVMQAMLAELRIHTLIFQMAFNLPDDMNSLRNDPNITLQ